MGQSRQFRAGQKAPNNGIYIEIGETGSTVNNPKRLKMKAGDAFLKTRMIIVFGHIKENHKLIIEAIHDNAVVFSCVFNCSSNF